MVGSIICWKLEYLCCHGVSVWFVANSADFSHWQFSWHEIGVSEGTRRKKSTSHPPKKVHSLQICLANAISGSLLCRNLLIMLLTVVLAIYFVATCLQGCTAVMTTAGLALAPHNRNCNSNHRTHLHIHTHIYVYTCIIYIYIDACTHAYIYIYT